MNKIKGCIPQVSEKVLFSVRIPLNNFIPMRLIKKYGFLLFLAVLFTNCAFIYFGMDTARTISKFLLLPILILYLWTHTRNKAHSLAVPVYGGLLFSFAGDLLLTRPGELFFLLGMLAFIGTHICNSIYFYKLQRLRIRRAKEALLALIILLVITIIVFGTLNPYLGNFKIPILVYMLIISIMAILATNTMVNPSVKRMAIQFFIPVSAMFVLSDALLSMNTCYFNNLDPDILLMFSLC